MLWRLFRAIFPKRMHLVCELGVHSHHRMRLYSPARQRIAVRVEWAERLAAMRDGSRGWIAIPADWRLECL